MLTNVDKCSKVGVFKNVEMKINLLTLVSNVKIYTLSPCLWTRETWARERTLHARTHQTWGHAHKHKLHMTLTRTRTQTRFFASMDRERRTSVRKGTKAMHTLVFQSCYDVLLCEVWLICFGCWLLVFGFSLACSVVVFLLFHICVCGWPVCMYMRETKHKNAAWPRHDDLDCALNKCVESLIEMELSGVVLVTSS